MTTKRITGIALTAALTVLCAWITVKGPVSFTLQIFAVYLAAMLLGPADGCLCVAVYLLLGAVGLPVFTGFCGGAGVLLGATGGYLIGFLLIPLCFLLYKKRPCRASFLLSCGMGLLLCYLFGSLWFYLLHLRAGDPVGFWRVLTLCVFPFVLPDAAKIALAWLIARRVRRTDK